MSTGLAAAGYDVTGVDIEAQPRYPFRFVQADMLDVLAGWDLSPFALIAASPPCQRYCRSTPPNRRGAHPDLLPKVRDLLIWRGVPWVIENVPGAPMRPDLKLCGCLFGLDELERERWFEMWRPPEYELRAPCYHSKPIVTVAGHGQHRNSRVPGRVADWRRAMGIDWMTRDELAQAIPAPYGEHVGRLAAQVRS